MTTENTALEAAKAAMNVHDDPSAPPTADELALVHPITGEVVALTDLSARGLVDLRDDLSEAQNRIAEYKRALTDELARRADQRGARTVELDGVRYEVNAPTEDVYLVDVLRAALEPLVEEELIAPELLDELIVTPKPKPPEPRVDRRRINALLKSDDRRLLAALASARRRQPTTRTAKVLGLAVEAEAIEEATGDE